MENSEQTAIRLLNDLVSLQNGAPLDRHKEEYDKLMNEIYAFIDSQSPTEPAISKMETTEFDTLQEGDFMVGSWDQYQQILKIAKHDFPGSFEHGMVFYRKEYVGDSGLKSRIHGLFEYEGKTQLTPEEFLRRADNTFKTK